jgi:hypothetical protein
MATRSRFTGLPKDDNTDRILKNNYLTPAYAATIALLINGLDAKTIIKPAALTGAVTFTVNVADSVSGDADNGPFVGDILEFHLTADSTSRVVTFSTGFSANGTLTVTGSSTAIIVFKFNGTAWQQTAVGNPRDVIDIQTPAYAASIAITTTKNITKVIPAQLTGALTLTAVVTSAVTGDILIFAFAADGTNRVVTFSTNIASAGTLTVVASKYGSATFIYNGTTWVETSRALTA